MDILISSSALVIINSIIKKVKKPYYGNIKKKMDQETYLKIRDELLPYQTVIHFIETNEFGADGYDDYSVKSIYDFRFQCKDPNFKFFHPVLNKNLETLKLDFENFLDSLARYTSWENKAGWKAVPRELAMENPNKYREAIDSIGKASENIGITYKELIKNGREILNV